MIDPVQSEKTDEDEMGAIIRNTPAARVAIGNIGFAASKCIWTLYQIRAFHPPAGAGLPMPETLSGTNRTRPAPAADRLARETAGELTRN